MKRLIFLALMLVGWSASAQQAFGEVQGYLVDKQTDEKVPYAPVFIEDLSGRYQAVSDADGSFRISAIPAGVYDVAIKFEMDTIFIRQVRVNMNVITRLGDIQLEARGTNLGDLEVTPGIVMLQGELPIPALDSKQIAQSVGRHDPMAMITSLSSEVRKTEDGELVFRGARKGDMLYIVDGVKSNDVYSIPSSAMNSMMVYTGALPAKYGDTLGGVVVVESKSYFDLYKAFMYGR